MDFRDKVCVVTGASSGIGRRVAVDLAGLGAKVCVAARRGDRLIDLVAEIGGEASGHSLKVTDVSHRDDARALAEHVRETHGRCDILINNAGFIRRGGLGGPTAVEDLEAVMGTNFFGAAYCTAELLSLLAESAPASVVNVTSMAGRLAATGSSSYCASKFALVGWSEALHFELKARGIFVSSVEPGPVPTEGFPQTELRSGRLMRRVLTSDAAVSKAILDAIEGRKLQRVVPRWYYLLQIPRLLSPPLFHALQTRIAGPYTTRPGR